MKPRELDQQVLAYFLLTRAGNMNIDGRFRRREEFIQMFEDAFFYSTQGFGGKAAGRHSQSAAALVDRLIASGCLAASHDKWSGTSYQFDAARYQAFIQQEIAANAVCSQARQQGAQFWNEVFGPA